MSYLRTLLDPMMQMIKANDSLMIFSLSRRVSALPLLRNFGLSNQLIKNLFSEEVYNYCSIVPLVNVKELDLTFISPFLLLRLLYLQNYFASSDFDKKLIVQ